MTTAPDLNPGDATQLPLPQEPAEAPAARSLWWYSWRRMRKNRLAMVGLAIITTMTLLAIFAPWVSPMDPNRQILDYVRKPSGFRGNVLIRKSAGGSYSEEFIVVNTFAMRGDSVTYTDALGRDGSVAASQLAGESESEWHYEPLYVLGTDGLGRDVLSRLIYGAQTSLLVGLGAQLLSLVIGVLLGALAGFFRGWVDSVIMYVANVVWSFPFILLVIALSLVWGAVWNNYVVPALPFMKDQNQGLWQAFIAIGVANWVDTARIVRGQFFSLRETEFVEATRALGFGSMRTIFRHMLPNGLGPLTVITTAGFASAIIAEASLSYLGLGVTIPRASWGQMINDGFGNILAGANWGLAIYPSATIALAVFGFNLLGDGLRDALDPKLKR